jgi:nucleoside-diphosphate-sugar epimerase
MLEGGHHVAMLNRGHTHDDLPVEVERLRADRRDDSAVRAAVGPRTFDMVLDNTTYTEADARQAVSVFRERTARHVFISSGQVYLVREQVSRPYIEADYDGPIVAEPPKSSPDHSEWLYGVDKRAAEHVFHEAQRHFGFPVTTLRLPMVASERDHYGRIQGYIERLMDGGPILVPGDGPGLPLRHVYVGDVARFVTALVATRIGIGDAFNISYGSSLTLAAFIELLASATRSEANVIRASRAQLESRGLLPNCSPFSHYWMSELDNAKSLRVFAPIRLEYTSPDVYLPAIVDDYVKRWITAGKVPAGYSQRSAELEFAKLTA